jgi:hypothetical protein
MIVIRRGHWIGIGAMLVLVASALLWGCGSGEGSSTASGSSSPLTKAQFVKAAEEICEEGLEGKEEVLKAAYEEVEAGNYKGSRLTQKRKETAEDMLPHYQQIAAELGELQPPPNDKAAVDDFLAKMKAGLAKAKANALSLVETNPFEQADTAAKAYGLTICGSI